MSSLVYPRPMGRAWYLSLCLCSQGPPSLSAVVSGGCYVFAGGGNQSACSCMVVLGPSGAQSRQAYGLI